MSVSAWTKSSCWLNRKLELMMWENTSGCRGRVCVFRGSRDVDSSKLRTHFQPGGTRGKHRGKHRAKGLAPGTLERCNATTDTNCREGAANHSSSLLQGVYVLQCFHLKSFHINCVCGHCDAPCRWFNALGRPQSLIRGCIFISFCLQLELLEITYGENASLSSWQTSSLMRSLQVHSLTDA